MRVIISNKFKHSYKKFIRSYPYLQNNIDNALHLLSIDPYSPNLATHKLSGELFEIYACKCGYDCRILFSIEEIQNEKVILLVDIGNHKDVY